MSNINNEGSGSEGRKFRTILIGIQRIRIRIRPKSNNPSPRSNCQNFQTLLMCIKISEIYITGSASNQIRHDSLLLKTSVSVNLSLFG
jgi:hypothetical protein